MMIFDKQTLSGYGRETGHPLEGPLEAFLLANRDWILAIGATVSWRIVFKPWAAAHVCVTPENLRPQVNERLIAAGFNTNMPQWDRHSDGHVMKGKPPVMIQVLMPAPSSVNVR